MPYEPINPIDQINNLADIFAEVRNLFRTIVNEWDETLFEEKYRQLLKDAWSELNDTYGEIHRQLQNPTFTLQEQLRVAGLWTDQRQFEAKLFGLKEVWTAFELSPTAKLLQILLKWLNDLFASLAKCIPGVDAWDEFKKLLENWIKKGKDLSDIPLDTPTE